MLLTKKKFCKYLSIDVFNVICLDYLIILILFINLFIYRNCTSHQLNRTQFKNTAVVNIEISRNFAILV